MAGLMRPPAAQGEAPGGPGGPMRSGAARRRKATPEEQRLHDDFVGNAIKTVYQPETARHIVALLSGGEGAYPVEELAKVTAMVISGVKASAEGAGREVPDAIVVRAAAKVASDIANELAPAAGLPKFEERQVQGAYFRAMEMLAEDRRAGAAETPPEAGEDGAMPPGNGLLGRPVARGPAGRNGHGGM